MITQAAIKDVNGKIWTLPRPNRHGDIAKYIQEEESALLLKDSVFGFIDESGKFYDRTEAWDHAKNNGQPFYVYNPVNPSDRKINEHPGLHGSLFSEDLW